jgi:hypothetical protein
MATENDIRSAAAQCCKLLKGGPSTVERIHGTVARLVRPGKFTPEEISLIIELVKYQLIADDAAPRGEIAR